MRLFEQLLLALILGTVLGISYHQSYPKIHNCQIVAQLNLDDWHCKMSDARTNTCVQFVKGE